MLGMYSYPVELHEVIPQVKGIPDSDPVLDWIIQVVNISRGRNSRYGLGENVSL